MSDAVEMTYLERSKRRPHQDVQTTSGLVNDSDRIQKNGTVDDSQHVLTTQSTFIDVTDLSSSRDSNKKSQGSRKVSTTTNESARKITCSIEMQLFPRYLQLHVFLFLFSCNTSSPNFS